MTNFWVSRDAKFCVSTNQCYTNRLVKNTNNQIIMSNETKTPRCRGGSRTRLKSHRGHPSSQSFRYTADHPKTLRQVAVAAKP